MLRFILFLCLACALQADQVVLKNGDTITGAIIKKDGGKLTIKSEFLGKVSMPWTAVKSIRADEPLTAELPNGQRVKGTVTTKGDVLEVATTSGGQPVPMTTVGALRDPAEELSWSGSRIPAFSSYGRAPSIPDWRWRAATPKPTPSPTRQRLARYPQR